MSATVGWKGQRLLPELIPQEERQFTADKPCLLLFAAGEGKEGRQRTSKGLKGSEVCPCDSCLLCCCVENMAVDMAEASYTSAKQGEFYSWGRRTKKQG